jgi:enamine deaminase RidA (YjgF/YER057c/UK114 family)
MSIRYIFLLLFVFIFQSLHAQDAEKRMAELNIVLPATSSPVASFVNAVRVGNLLYLSGKGPKRPDGTYLTGKVGASLSVEEGKEAARMTGLIILAELKHQLNDLNKVKRIVKVLGMVNATPDFDQQPKVINGFSDLMIDVFGDKGKHARSAVGVCSLPFNMAVEIEVIVEVEN